MDRRCSRTRSRAVRGAVALALALTACGGESAPSAPVLARAAGTSAPDAERVVASLPLAARAVQGGVAEGTQDGVGLRLTGGRDVLLSVPGPLARAGWDLVAVDVVAGSEVTLRAGLVATGETVGCPDTPHLRAGERRRVTFDLRARAVDGPEFDALLLGANGPDDLAVELRSLELVARPAARWLPAVEDGPGPVALAGETRAAVALTGAGPLELRRAPAGGEVLQLGFGAPDRAPVEGVRLVARAGDAPLGAWDVPAGAWTDARVPLPRGAGTVTFELRGADELLAVALEVPRAFRPRDDAPSVLLVTSDTHRGDHLGASEHGVGVRTPHLDALAARGVTFEDCLSSSNVTLPSHAALLAGLTPRETGVTDNRTPLDADQDTLPRRFAGAGWATFAATSTKLLAPGWSGLGAGWERLAAPASDLSRPGREAVQQLERWLPAAAGRPLFAWLHVYEAHRPYAPPEGWAEAYYPPDRDPYDERLELGGPDVPGSPGVRDRAWIDALYRGEVAYVDDLVGGLLERTRLGQGIVAFTADHGECLGDQGLWWDHLAAYPAVLHVPLVLAWPGGPEGLRVEAGVRQVEVSRTLLELAGVEAEGFPGTSLLRWLAAPDAPPEPRFAVADEGQAVALTEGPWHLIVHLHLPNKPHLITRDVMASPVQLFDRSRDPECAVDRSREEGERGRMRAMAERLVEWVEAAPERRTAGHALDEESRAMLSGLGYAAGEGVEGAGFVDGELLRERLGEWLR